MFVVVWEILEFCFVNFFVNLKKENENVDNMVSSSKSFSIGGKVGISDNNIVIGSGSKNNVDNLDVIILVFKMV